MTTPNILKTKTFCCTWLTPIRHFLSIAVVQVKSANAQIVMTITDPRGKKIETMRDQADMRHHFAAFYSGNYQICIQNMNSRTEERYEFLIETGVSAMDYSNIVTKKHLKPVELQATKIQDMVA